MKETEHPPLEDVWMDRESILGRVWTHLNELAVNPDTTLYFYSALELRFWIESLFFEILVRLKSGKLNKRDLRVYKPKEFAVVLDSLDPDFLSKAGADLGFTVTPDDLDRIMKIYGQLGRYLHLPKEPFILKDQGEWKDSFEELVINAYNYLNDLTGHKWP